MCRQPSGKQVSFTDNDSSRSSSRQGSPSHSPSPNERCVQPWGAHIAGSPCAPHPCREDSLERSACASHSAKKRRQTPGGKFNALFRRNTSSKSGAGGDAGARNSYMRNAAGDAAYSGNKGAPFASSITCEIARVNSDCRRHCRAARPCRQRTPQEQHALKRHCLHGG